MSYCIYVGHELTQDGRAYLAGYGDEPSSHWLEIVPRAQHAAGSMIEVGVTPDAVMPGVRTQIPQVAETARHIRVSYSHYQGVPAPITNGGLNEHGVAVRDVWSPSSAALIAMTPTDQRGPSYSDLARIVLERATTARHGVELIGELIAAHGYSTYGGNSHFIADQHEGWVVIEFAGGQGLWAAQRVGSDAIRVSRPGYIGEIPLDDALRPTNWGTEILGSDNLITFAMEQGWYEPKSNSRSSPYISDRKSPVPHSEKPEWDRTFSEENVFDVNAIYGDGKFRHDGVVWIEEEMRARAGSISLVDMMWAVRTHRLTGDTAGYGQVVPLDDKNRAELGLLWHTPSAAVVAPFTPVFMGTQAIPPEYGKHRYLTSGESARFADGQRKPEVESTVPMAVEATRSAFRASKRLLYFVLDQHERFLPEVTEAVEAFEARLIDAQADVERTAATLLDAGEVGLATRYLTYYSEQELMAALRLVEALTASVEARTKLLVGIRNEGGYRGPEQVW